MIISEGALKWQRRNGRREDLMAEIGAGGGSGYPGVIDTDATLETTSDFARIAVPNDLAAAIVAIQGELGVDPAGTYSTVVLRLDGMMAKGHSSARPAAATIDIGIYFSEDLGIWEITEGTEWLALPVGGM